MQGNCFYIAKTNRGSKKEKATFDIRMEAFDGAEICQLIGIFMLSLLSKHINMNHIGLYGDDGLAILKNTSDPEAKNSRKIFKYYLKKKI